MSDTCKRCNDKGYLQADSVYCPDCNGQGIGPYHPTDTVKCKTCDGSGMVNTLYVDGRPTREMADCPDCSCTQPVDDSPDQSGDAADMIDHVPDAGQKVEPPQGYETWLEAAIACMDTVAGIDAARAELAELRAHVNDRVDKAWNNGYKIGKVAGHRAAKEIDDA